MERLLSNKALSRKHLAPEERKIPALAGIFLIILRIAPHFSVNIRGVAG